MRLPALIVGGGPAGAAAAMFLARAGVEPLLVERHSLPQDGVCGGFLGWDALAALSELGLDPWALGARPISRLRLIAGGRVVEAGLPQTAAGLSRRALDGALVEAAAAAGATVKRGRTARSADPATRTVRFDDGDAVVAEAIFLATGKHELRGLNRRFTTSSVGLRAQLAPSPARTAALADVVELHLFDHGYAGLLLQEDGSANLCLTVTHARLSKAGNVPALLSQLLQDAPALAERLHGDIPAHFDAVAGVPYGWRARDSDDGVFRIGDQGAVIASLAGDGIAIALTSGIGAARALLAHGPGAAPDWQRTLHRRSGAPLALAEALRHGAANPATRRALMTVLRLMPRLGAGAAALTRISRG